MCSRRSSAIEHMFASTEELNALARLEPDHMQQQQMRAAEELARLRADDAKPHKERQGSLQWISA